MQNYDFMFLPSAIRQMTAQEVWRTENLIEEKVGWKRQSSYGKQTMNGKENIF